MKRNSCNTGNNSFPFCYGSWLDVAFRLVRAKSFKNLGLAALVVLSAISSRAQPTFHNCPLEGTAKSDAAKTLDRNKNRFTPPVASDFDASVSLAAMLAPGDDTDRFDESKAVSVTGFVVNVKTGGKETCNCGANDPIDKDTHIELALSTNAPKNQRIIVEVTPRLRAIMKQQNIDWSTTALADKNQGIKGKWVEISGWLLFDVMHVGEAENTSPGHPNNWRATCWEIHPITKIQVVSDSPSQPPPGLQPIHADLMNAFHRARVRDFAKGDKKAKLVGRNNDLLAKFDPSEKETDDISEEVELPGNQYGVCSLPGNEVPRS